MRIVVTGQVGMDKKPFLERVTAAAAAAGRRVRLWNVGEMMYAEAPGVADGRILDLPLSRLTLLRRSVFKDILADCADGDCVVNTHATFRWRHGLFYAFDYDLMKQLNADIYVTLVDNIDRVHARLVRDGHNNHTLKDLMIWREEEIMATELLSQIVRGHGCFYVLARGSDAPASGCATGEVLVDLMCWPRRKKAYLSFPMSHVGDAATLALIRDFRAEMKRHLTCFDPGDLEETHLGPLALAAAEAGERFVTINVDGEELRVDTADVLAILPDIDGQLYARDFKLIEQADMIISLIPAVAARDGSSQRPGISSGVERELQHAYESAKDVFVIWLAEASPSPFITETATRVFRSVAAAAEFLRSENCPTDNRLAQNT